MEILERNAVIPSFFDWCDFVSLLFCDIRWAGSFGDSHYLERVRLKEECKCIPTDFFAC